MRSLAAGFLLILASAQVQAQTMAERLEKAGAEKGILCAPVLVKFGTLLDLAAYKQALDRNPEAARTRNAAFQILYRGYALNALAKASDPAALDAAWKAPMDSDRSTVSRLAGLCVDFYNSRRKAGAIPDQVEKDAGARANAAMKRK